MMFVKQFPGLCESIHGDLDGIVFDVSTRCCRH